jgi:hypothetical protein
LEGVWCSSQGLLGRQERAGDDMLSHRKSGR